MNLSYLGNMNARKVKKNSSACIVKKKKNNHSNDEDEPRQGDKWAESKVTKLGESVHPSSKGKKNPGQCRFDQFIHSRQCLNVTRC